MAGASDVRDLIAHGDESTLLVTGDQPSPGKPQEKNKTTEVERPFLYNLYFTYAKLFITRAIPMLYWCRRLQSDKL